MRRTSNRVLILTLGWAVTLTGCAGPGQVGATSTTAPPIPVAGPASSTTSLPVTTTSTQAPSDPHQRPEWLGTRVLPLRTDGFGEVQATPPELAPRHLSTVDRLPPPASGMFESSIGPVPSDVLGRSTWHEGCPVRVEDLSYVTVTHFGFDGLLHTGEMIVNRAVAEGIVSVFEQLYDAAYPIEEMRVVSASELDLPPTGDGNLTTSFVCRSKVESTSWSQHAYGLAVDVNPFQNPYVRDDLVLPELAGYYTDRDRAEAGMIGPGSLVVRAFGELGWGWGGAWTSLKDWMHFSADGR